MDGTFIKYCFIGTVVLVGCAYDIPVDVGESTDVYFANIIRLRSPKPLGSPRKNAEGNSLAEECWFIDFTTTIIRIRCSCCTFAFHTRSLIIDYTSKCFLHAFHGHEGVEMFVISNSILRSKM